MKERQALNVYFSSSDVRTDAQDAVTLVLDDHYVHPAIIPPMPRLPRTPVRTPVLYQSREVPGGIRLEWQDLGFGRTRATSFAIYRVAGHASFIDIADATNLVATVRSQGGAVQRWTDTTAIPGEGYTYVITAMDRLWNETAPSRPQHT